MSESRFPGFEDFQDVNLSESGFPGFKDFQDVNLSESGYSGFEDFQDIKNMNKMKIMKSCSSLNPGYPDSDILPKTVHFPEQCASQSSKSPN